MVGKIDGDKKVMAAAQQIVKSLGNSKDMKDMISILSNFDNRLASMNDLFSADFGGVHKNMIEGRIEAAEKVVRRWESLCSNPRKRNSLRWEDCPVEATEYLSAVDDVLHLKEDLSSSTRDMEMKDRADIILQQAMFRMEDEFRRVLIRSAGPLDVDRLVRILVKGHEEKRSTTPLDTDRLDRIKEGHEQKGQMEKGGSSTDDKFLDLINPDAIPKLKEIADRMIKSGYEKECHQAYCNTLREVLDEFLSTLGSEKLSIEEVQKVEWKLLSEKMKKWNQALYSVVKVLLPSEKHLFDQIFDGSKLVREACFIETTKGSVMQLLNFAEAIVIGKRSSEKLCPILDMHSALADVMPNLQALFPNDSGGSVCSEAQGILKELGDSAMGALAEFENIVRPKESRKVSVYQSGDIHPFTIDVMIYVQSLVKYDSLNMLLESWTYDSYEVGRDSTTSDIMSLTPVGRFLRSLFMSLELNLKEKSKMYEDGALQYVFLMNNMLYIVQEVKGDSKLGTLLGDTWVRQHRGQVRQYANSYLRAAWSKALSFLKEEGLRGSGNSSSISKVTLKERFKGFNACFEEIYRNQTGWKVPDCKLREDLRISISQKALPAYRSFVGRFHSHLDRGRNAAKYIKYSPDDLEDYLVDLFEGSPAILHHPRRKPSSVG